MNLRNNEQFFIWRRRLGLTQGQAAQRLRISRYAYCLLERQGVVGVCVVPPQKNLTPVEKCTLLRIRKGMTQAALARKLGITRFWLRQMELGKGNPTRLINYWRRHGLD